ncbi:LPXTG cell wall anchor domain-containing protein, partial [Rothia sp. 88186D007BW]
GTIDNGSVWVNENLNPAPIEEAPLVTDKGPGVTHELPEGHIGINGPGTTAEPKPTIDPSTIVVDDKTPATDEPSAPAVEETPAAEETSAPAVEETSAPAADETSAPAVEETEAAAAPVASNGTTQAPAAQAPAAQAPAANNAQQQNLAQTGASNATLLALGGLAVLVLGAGAVVAARRFQA